MGNIVAALAITSIVLLVVFMIIAGIQSRGVTKQFEQSIRQQHAKEKQTDAASQEINDRIVD